MSTVDSALDIDRQPFESLFTPLLSSAYGAALRLVRTRPDAEDLVQEAALQAFRAYHTFQPGTNFKAWFFRILTNCFISRYRRNRKERDDLALDDIEDLYLYRRTVEAGIHGSDTSPVQTLLGKLDEEQIGEAMARLPGDYRAVATLYFIEDFSYEQIAGVMGCPIGTVRSRLHRARKMLQRALWQVAVDQGLVSRLTAPEAS
ncbi:MAG TPA: sigma-70 family RNA polymerase sigma factor [Gemmatimonadales bacterium]|jgi:RNA polymerase sigma-70 factor (ECF subfamily)|nr:sigma-70 family RNA polymerase sigma factor [Gemmatimonadales bacterium]